MEIIGAEGELVDVLVPVRFTLGRQSSLAPEGGLGDDGDQEEEKVLEEVDEIDPTFQLMYLANEGDLEGITELLDSGVNINFQDIDGRTALHIAACQGVADVVELLISRGADIDPTDRWGSTPLADAIHYKNHNVIKLLEKSGAKPLMAPMHVLTAREIPEYEIDCNELDFSESVVITKGTFRIASWRGIQVAVKELQEDFMADEEKVWVGHIFLMDYELYFLLLVVSLLNHSSSLKYSFFGHINRNAFRDELALLQRIRHPNVVQFLGAVTQSSPMMIVTEYLPKGDLRAFLKRRGALKPETAVKFALDIARGMSYLHEHKTEAIIHCDLEPSNILRDDTGHLKVADFGISKILNVAKTVREDKPVTCRDNSCRYVAPEVFRNEEYDTKVDVFSFAIILQEMIEGQPPFSTKEEDEAATAYAAKERPPFKAPHKLYSHGLRELIEECWSEVPANRPTFKQIIEKLNAILKHFDHKRRWTTKRLKCFHLEAMWKKDHSHSDGSSRSTSSTFR
ncbi:hypothetical protein C5167_011216 [Papaver somniferum]|uniref:non-specific serine/threonine protein kinase n=1 Tax=Papaver somniferum TaxID=3469 RepID=A0A4Y7K2B7_PAPSO|nr:integrin-linked protein kinase 1-like isoform X1 [Papaver somniferum]RZC67513.1 hypothetical protein C5167_011216 [Papaver somniferum]